MISNALIRTVKGTLETDLTPMQTQILKRVLSMMMNSVCYEIDELLSDLDKKLRTK